MSELHILEGGCYSHHSYQIDISMLVLVENQWQLRINIDGDQLTTKTKERGIGGDNV